MKRLLSHYIIIVFCIVLVLPVLFKELALEPDLDIVIPQNNAIMLPPPESARELKPYLDSISDYIRGEFGLRDLLASWDIALRINWLDSFMLKVKTTFIEREYVIPCDFRNLNEYAMLQYIKPFKENFEKLKAQDIPYILFLAPPKAQLLQSVACDPDSFHRNTFAELIQEEAPEIPVIDSFPSIRKLDDQSKAFYKLDRHWNDAGAFIGYQTLIQQLQTFFTLPSTLKQEDFRFETYEVHPRSIAVYAQNRPPDVETVTRWHPKTPFQAKRLHPPPEQILGVWEYNQGYEHYIHTDSSLPRALVLHDSMMKQLKPWLAEHFSETYYVWSKNLDMDLVKEFQPDVVIHQLVK